jgi:ATP-dependent helicase/nuclease subunit A
MSRTAKAPFVTAADDESVLYAFRRNLVVVASAGTGKTHALVGVLVHLALGGCEAALGGLQEPVPLSRIVATTFSRKAAAEIRARLVQELTRLVVGDPNAAYRSSLLAACDAASLRRFRDDEIASRARTALEGVARARIGTLHGFAVTVVRAHSLALGLPSGFSVETESESRERARRVLSLELEELALRREHDAFALIALAGGTESLLERAAQVLDCLSEDGRPATDLQLATSDAREIDSLLTTLVEHARALADDRVLGAAARSVCDAWISTNGDLEDAVSKMCAVAARGKWSDAAEAFFEFRSGLPGATNEGRGRNLVKLWSVRDRIVPRAALFKTLLVRAHAALRTSMLRDGMLGFSEVLRVARDVLRDDPNATLALGRDLDALLIDELQDTSRIQREIVELAWQDPTSGAAAFSRLGRVRRRGLLVVGDRKQSIYGFRGADVGAFAELCVGLAGRPAREALRIAAGSVWEPEHPNADFVALRRNRRSAPEILSFVNAYSAMRLVPSAEPKEPYEVEYAPEVEDLLPAEEGGPAPPMHPRTSWIRLPTSGASGSSRLSEGEAMARRIASMIEGGSPPVRGEPPRWSDIAVLARTRAMLDATAYALARAGIPYVVAGNGFFSAREVRDVVAMLAFLVDPDDVLSRLVVLRGPWCGVSDETLIALSAPHVGLLDVDGWDDAPRRLLIPAEDRGPLDALRDVVLSLRGTIASIGPAEALRLAMRALSLEETLILLTRGEQRVANVRKVLSLAEGEASARAFLARMNRAASEQSTEPEAATFSDEEDAVRLLTVHASKGLDFPIVFLPEVGSRAPRVRSHSIALRLGAADAPSLLATRALMEDGTVLGTPSYAAAERDQTRREVAEQARLAYVAATRAREAMVFVGDRAPPKGVPSEAYLRSTAAVLAALTEGGGASAAVSLVADSGSETRAPTPKDAFSILVPARRLGVPSSRRVDLTATELVDFVLCPRRFQLAHVTLLAEVQPSRAPAPEVLESQSRYARRVAREARAVHRGRRFLARACAEGGVSVSIEGAVDLWIEWADGRVDAVFLVGRPPFALPRVELTMKLAAFAHVGRPEVRTGLVEGFEADAEDPVWCERADLQGMGERLLAWGASLAEARWVASFPRAPLSTCRAIHCGYVSLCHPERPRVQS